MSLTESLNVSLGSQEEVLKVPKQAMAWFLKNWERRMEGGCGTEHWGAGRELRRLSSDWGESLFQVRVQSRGGQTSLTVKDAHCGPSGGEKDMEGES